MDRTEKELIFYMQSDETMIGETIQMLWQSDNVQLTMIRVLVHAHSLTHFPSCAQILSTESRRELQIDNDFIALAQMNWETWHQKKKTKWEANEDVTPPEY